jgi:hypothetical protein
MPMVNGKKYAYTPEGMKQAEQARQFPRPRTGSKPLADKAPANMVSLPARPGSKATPGKGAISQPSMPMLGAGPAPRRARQAAIQKAMGGKSY